MKLKILAVVAALGIAGFAGPAAARVDVSIGIGLPGAVYYEPAPVYREYYYEPAPRYYYGPSRVYYYERRPVYHYYREERRYDRWHHDDGRRGWRGDGHHGGGHHDQGPRQWRHSR